MLAVVPLLPIIILALAGVGVVALAASAGKSGIMLQGKALPPPRMAKTVPENFGAKVCTFGDAEHCYWRPAKVSPEGLKDFEWGFCLATWKSHLSRNIKGGVKAAQVIVDVVLAIVNVLTVGLSGEALERLCFRFRWRLRRYKYDGKTYFAVRYVEPQKHILTGETVKPPLNPLGNGSDVCWVHKYDPGEAVGYYQLPKPVYAVFYQDGTYRDIISQEDIRTLLRDAWWSVPILNELAKAASDEKPRWYLATKSKAEGLYE